jgi:streptomycin 6-kinase
MASVDAAIIVLEAILRPRPAERGDVHFLDVWFDRFQERHKQTDFPRAAALKALAIYGELSAQPGRTYYIHGDFHPGNIVTSARRRFLAIDPKGLIGHIGYDIAVFLNNLHWWQKNTEGVGELLAEAIVRFGGSFSIDEKDLREWAYATMVIGAWWNLEDMPEHYEGDSAISEVWGV